MPDGLGELSHQGRARVQRGRPWYGGRKWSKKEEEGPGEFINEGG